jgi:hypothetical protein
LPVAAAVASQVEAKPNLHELGIELSIRASLFYIFRHTLLSQGVRVSACRLHINNASTGSLHHTSYKGVKNGSIRKMVR